MKIPACADCGALWPGVLPATVEGINAHMKAVGATKCRNCWRAFELTCRAFTRVFREATKTRRN